MSQSGFKRYIFADLHLAKRAPMAAASDLPGVVATVGNFDGLHRGHQQLVAKTVALAKKRNGPALMVSFYPHPVEVLSARGQVPRLTTLRQTLHLCAGLGISEYALVHFTEAFSHLSTEQFVGDFLCEKLGVRDLVLGPDARFGKSREGTPEVITQIAQKYGCHVHVESFLEQGNAVVSSRRIRGLLDAGEVAQAASLLGRPYTMDVKIHPGQGKGAGLGFPTANALLGKQIIPLKGVYATRAELEGVWYSAVTNVGVRPSFGGTSLQVETHLLDFPYRTLYKKRLALAFIERIREEKKFASLDELKLQIAADVATARTILK